MPGRMCDSVLKVRSYLSFVKDKHTLGKKRARNGRTKHTVGGVPNFTMSAYEPNHHSVQRSFIRGHSFRNRA